MKRNVPAVLRKLFNFYTLVFWLAVYLNIGWAFGAYYTTYIFQKTPQTFWQVVWGGGYGFWTSAKPSELLVADQIIFSIFWPLLAIAVPFISWLVYGLHYLLWLVGWGGVAKLFGVG